MPNLCSLVGCVLCNAIFDLLYLFTVWPLQSNLQYIVNSSCLQGLTLLHPYLSMGYNLLAGKAFFNPLQILLTVLKLVHEQYLKRSRHHVCNDTVK